jgi:hypothetical protein
MLTCDFAKARWRSDALGSLGPRWRLECQRKPLHHDRPQTHSRRRTPPSGTRRMYRPRQHRPDDSLLVSLYLQRGLHAGTRELCHTRTWWIPPVVLIQKTLAQKLIVGMGACCLAGYQSIHPRRLQTDLSLWPLKEAEARITLNQDEVIVRGRIMKKYKDRVSRRCALLRLSPLHLSLR